MNMNEVDEVKPAALATKRGGSMKTVDIFLFSSMAFFCIICCAAMLSSVDRADQVVQPAQLQIIIIVVR
jgi:hypothetical protein